MKLIIEKDGKKKEIEQTTVSYGPTPDEQARLEKFEKKLFDEVARYLNTDKDKGRG